MYLSRIEINKQRMETKRALLNLQIMHASAKACFPESSGRVWRTDVLRYSLYRRENPETRGGDPISNSLSSVKNIYSPRERG
jgi:hypothetical protein